MTPGVTQSFASLVPPQIICKINLGNRLAAHIFATKQLRKQNQN